MSNAIENVLAQALILSPDERVALVERLLASFAPEVSVDAAWLQRAHERREQVRAGEVALVAGDEALARVRARLA